MDSSGMDISDLLNAVHSLKNIQGAQLIMSGMDFSDLLGGCCS